MEDVNKRNEYYYYLVWFACRGVVSINSWLKMSMMFLWNRKSIEFHSDISHVREKERKREALVNCCIRECFSRSRKSIIK